MKAKRVIQSFCLLLVAASVAMGQKVNVDWNRGADFLRYKTYAWGICEIPEELELWQGRIVQNVEAQLAARGFRKTDDISRKSEKNIKRLRKAVAKLFEDYPLYLR